MRILAIRGANLASLAAPFEVSLSEGPLAGAGLFAIVGETGAGKSTLLDAICLALYGKCPRVVAAGDAAEVPDVERLPGGDPRTVLRRGAVSGFAQVDFAASDGECYRATWNVRRARNKANGRLQNAERSLVLLKDNQGVAEGVEQTRLEIEKRIGLTFDQFRRAVLLAQGDFDAFLRADDKDRADLLEKVTGTEIYGRVSRYVHETAREKARTVENLRQRLADVGGLDADVRLVLETQLQKATAELAVARSARDSLQADLGIALKANEAREALEEAERQMQVAKTAWDEAEPDRTRLQIIAQADQLATTLRAEARERSTLEAAVLEADKAKKDSEAAAEAKELLKAGAVAASTAYSAEETLFKKLGPVWTQAEQLDGRLKDADANCTTAESAVSNAVAQLAAADTTLSEIDGRLVLLRQSSSDADELQRSLPDLSAFSARAAEVASDFEAYIEADIEQVAVTTTLEAHRSDVVRLSNAEVQSSAALIMAEAAVGKADTRWQAASSGVPRIDQEGTEVAASSLESVVRELGICVRAIGTFVDATARKQAGETSLAAAAGRLTEIMGRRALLDTERGGLEGELRAALRFRILADDTVEATASQMRRSLEPDAPCPVCGSPEHPFAVDHEAAGRLAATQRAEVERIAREQERVDQALEATLVDVEREREATSEITASVRSAAEGIGAAETTWATSRSSALAAAEAAKLDGDLPATPGASDAMAAARRFEEAASHRLQATRDELTSLRRGRVLVDEAAQALRTAEAEAKQARLIAASGKDALAQAKLDEAALAVAVEHGTRKTLESSARVQPVLIAIGLTADEMKAGPRAVSDQVQQKLRTWNELDKALSSIREQIAIEETNQVGAAATREARSEAVETARGRLSEQLNLRDQLKGERASLLDGESTALHRTRHNDSRLAAQVADREAQERLVEGQMTLERALGHATASDEARKASSHRLLTLETEADAALLQANLNRTLADEILAIPEEVRRELDLRVQSLRELRDASQQRFGLRSTEWETAKEAVTFEASIEELEAALIAATEVFEAVMKVEAERATVLRGDDERREAANDLRVALEAAEGERVIHIAVSDAIGSADGSRFRRIAQRVTLRALVASANKQLEVLGPRYRLALTSDEGLGLLAVDLEMGDELRSTRSLSGGERFLVSLALALALSNIEGKGTFVETLFIDEGFGSLDPTRLDLVVDALEALQSTGRQVGVITHVPGMIDRIANQVRVENEGGGKSRVVVDARQ